MKKLLIPLFLFLIVLALPVHAYVSVEQNVSYGGGIFTIKGFACSNATGTVYCYVMGCPSSNPYGIRIERYNATLGNYTWCSTGINDLNSNCPNELGWAVANSSLMLMADPLYYRWFNISDAAFAAHACPQIKFNLSTTFNTSNPTVGGGYFGTASDGWNYWGLDNGIKNSTTGENVASGFWDLSHIKSLRLPNQSDNSSVYGSYDGFLFQYTNGAFSGNIGYNNTFGDIYGQSVTDDMVWDLVKYNATYIKAYWIHHTGIGTNRLYSANFSTAIALGGGSYIVAVHPIGGEATGDTTPELHAIVYSALNGTIEWTIDGSIVGNSTGTTDGVSFDVYFTADTLATGSHTWSATFYDSAGYSWSTGTQTFNISTAYEGSDYTGPDQVEALGDYLDTAFSSPFGGEIFALLMSGLIAGVIWYYSGHSKIEYLMAPLMFILACFSFIGMFPIWFMVLEVMTVALFIFFKVKG